MSAERPIDLVRERLTDLVNELRKARAHELAERIASYRHSFTHVTGVRRSVNELSRMLETLRQRGDGLPESAQVHIAANHLEDACRAALRAGIIAPAAPTLAAQAKRKTYLILLSAVGGLVALLIPTALIALGFGLDDLRALPPVGPYSVARGDLEVVTVTAPEAPVMDQVTVTPRYVLDQPCEASIDPEVLSCGAVESHRQLAQGLKTQELRRAGEAHGLLVALRPPQMHGDRARLQILVRATDETPLGRYVIPLQASYGGYGFDPDCPPLSKRLRACPRLRDRDLVDDTLSPQVLHIDVVGGAAKNAGAEPALAEAVQDSSGTAEQAMDAIDERLEAIEAAQQAGDFVRAVQLLESAKERLAELEQSALRRPEKAPSADALEMVRLLVLARADDLAAIEHTVFEAYYRLATRKGKREPQEVDLAALAKRLDVDEPFVIQVLERHAPQLAERQGEMEAEKRKRQLARQQALQAKCGPLPQDSWTAIEHFLRARSASSTTQVKLSECLSPRLDDVHCWQVVCDYDQTTRRNDGTRYGARLRGLFQLRHGKVVNVGSPRERHSF